MNITISIIIPTYKREEVLLDTIQYLLKQGNGFEELLVIDQTPRHKDNVKRQLNAWHKQGLIRWIQLKRPSTTKALNLALFEAKSEVILILDDDIMPDDQLVHKHIQAYAQDENIWAVVGQVIRPEKKPSKDKKTDYGTGLGFQFDSTRRRFIQNASGANLSFRKEKAIEAGGFDENFIGAAFRFETEFVERLIEKGGKVLFEPQASIRHLRAKEGGVRVFGDFRKTWLPLHAVGAYYYFFRSKKVKFPLLNSLGRLVKSIYTRHHLHNPWWIPATLIAETLGFFLAILLVLNGPRFIREREG